MSTTPPPVLDGQKPASDPAARRLDPPPRPPASASSILVRVAISAVLMTGYVVWHARVFEALNNALRALTGAEPASGTPPALAVTLLGLLLVAVWWRFVKSDVRFHAPILITFILAVGHASYGILENHHSDLLARLTGGRLTQYSPTFVAIIVTILVELVLSRLLGGKWPHLASAYISGLSVGILIKSPAVLPYILCGAITIVSKYAIRFRGRHLWNPSNFGVSLMIYLWYESVAPLSVQLSNEIWPILIIWCLGSLILWRLGRLHITVAYAAAFLLLGFVRSALTGDSWLVEVAPITGPPYQLFIFFMITDPKTTTKAKWSQCVVAVLVAIAETIFRLNRVVHAPYYALFFVGPVTNLIEILWDGRRGKTKPAEAAKSGTPSAPAATAAVPSGDNCPRSVSA